MKDHAKYWIYGASGHGKVVLDCLEASNIKVDGFIDDDLSKTSLNELSVFSPDYINVQNDKVVFGIGENNIRKKLAESLSLQYQTVIHPATSISPYSKIGVGTVVFHQAVIQSCSVIGKHCIINTKASIDHDGFVGDYVHISPGAILCGNVSIGDLTWVGAGAVIIQGVIVGSNVVIGAGSVVIHNIPDHAVVVGNPGRIIKFRK